MTIEKIIQKIEAETNAEVRDIINEARRSASDLKKDADIELSQKLKQLQDQGEKRTTIMRNIHLSEARRKTRRSILSAKEELIEKCFNEARERLRNLSGEKYRSIMAKLVKEALALVGDSAVATLTRAEDKNILSAYPKITVKSEIAKGLGGLIIESADGKIVVDNTFDAILKRQMEEIRTEVANILYTEE